MFDHLIGTKLVDEIPSNKKLGKLKNGKGGKYY